MNIDKRQNVRVNDFHWECLITFMESHPNLAVGRIVGPNGKRQNKELWNDLGTLLNVLGYGSKSVEKWQKTWADFKQSLKKKASEIRKDITVTGGGLGCQKQLNKFEERALQILGASFSDGVGSAEIGLPTATSAMSAIPIAENIEHETPSTSSAFNYDHSYNRKRKRDCDAQYEETISILKDIKNVMDSRLEQVVDVLERYVDKKSK